MAGVIDVSAVIVSVMLFMLRRVTGGHVRGRSMAGMGAVVMAVVAVIVSRGLDCMITVYRLLFTDEGRALVVFPVFLSLIA